MIFEACLLLSLVACARAGDRFGGAHHGYQGARIRGPGYAATATAGSYAAEPSYLPQPYSFGYDNTDEYGTQAFHKEESDANNVKTGSYGYRDANGLFRIVRYVADANGFRVTIDTNEPGTRPGSSADAVFNAKPVVAPAATQVAGYGAGRQQGYGRDPAGGYGSRVPWTG